MHTPLPFMDPFMFPGHTARLRVHWQRHKYGYSWWGWSCIHCRQCWSPSGFQGFQCWATKFIPGWMPAVVAFHSWLNGLNESPCLAICLLVLWHPRTAPVLPVCCSYCSYFSLSFTSRASQSFVWPWGPEFFLARSHTLNLNNYERKTIYIT